VITEHKTNMLTVKWRLMIAALQCAFCIFCGRSIDVMFMYLLVFDHCVWCLFQLFFSSFSASHRTAEIV